MVTSVELQEPMSYYLFWLILAIVAVAAVFFIQIFFRVILREQLKRHKEIGIVMRRILSNGLEEKTKEILTKLYLIKNGQDSETEKELLS